MPSYIKRYKDYRSAWDKDQTRLGFNNSELENQSPFKSVIKKLKNYGITDFDNIEETGSKLYSMIMEKEIKPFEYEYFVQFMFLNKTGLDKVLRGSTELLKYDIPYKKVIARKIQENINSQLSGIRNLKQFYGQLELLYSKTFWIEEFWENKYNDVLIRLKTNI